MLLCTAIVQPYGKSRLLNYLELLTLTAIFMTLWAGNVFNANPRCEDGKGGTVAWCDTISIAVGAIDIIMLVAVVATMVYYKKQKQCDACLRKARRSHHELEEEEDTGNMNGAGVEVFTNPSLDAATANSAQKINIEMTTTNHSKILDDYIVHKTEEGDLYYQNRSSGLTQWDEPGSSEPDASVPSTTPQHHKRNSTQVPLGWDKQMTDAGQRYYSNDTTQESEWNPPEGSTGGRAEKSNN